MNSYAAARASIDIARRPPHRRQNRCANLVERGAGERRHAVCDAIVPVLCVPAEVAIEPVSHVQEFLCDHHLQRSPSRLVDARQVDQNEMIAGRGRKRISAANRASQSPAQPSFEDATLGRDAETIRWQPEKRDVSFQKLARFLMVDQPFHSDLPGGGLSPRRRVEHRVRRGVWGEGIIPHPRGHRVES